MTTRLLQSTETGDGIDAIILQCLEAVAAVYSLGYSSPQQSSKGAKCRIFWKTLREIADHEINKTSSTSSDALKHLMIALPYAILETDGRMWLPMHCAMSIPNVELDDVDILFAREPESIKQESCSNYKVTPCHLAMMTEEYGFDSATKNVRS